MRVVRLAVVPVIALALACGEDPLPSQPDGPSLRVAGVPGAGAVYVASNAAAGNAVLVFPRSGQGTLGAPTAVATGGEGTGGPLGNQSGLVLRPDGRLLFVVNAGSDEISVFGVSGQALTLLGTTPSGGDLPISLALHGDLLYVLHDGTSPNVTGFRVGPHGGLTPIPGSTRDLTGPAPDAAQVGFAPDGSRLVVTAKATNQLITFAVQSDGTLGTASTQTSAGQTPFGFAFDRRGTLLVSEAFGGAPDASTLSSYRAAGSGWSPVSPTTATTETAACWVAATPNGRFVYTTNTGSASVTGFGLSQDGSLNRLDADGATGLTGMGPVDLAITASGRFLYTLNAGSASVTALGIAADGSLTPIGTVSGLPAGANGLAVQ